jgi:hypothetical protein
MPTVRNFQRLEDVAESSRRADYPAVLIDHLELMLGRRGLGERPWKR